jgi:ABC-type multidrug transport system fused ATPase/permease subunit
VVNRLGLRLETIGALIVFFAAFFIVMARDTIEPGLAGLSLSYALQITASFFWLVRQSVESENCMNSVERSKYYTTQIEHEDLTIDRTRLINNSTATLPHKSLVADASGHKKSADWPCKGKIEFIQLEMRYRPGLPLVLKQISVKIRGGERVGVVGRTGAGKVKLLQPRREISVIS